MHAEHAVASEQAQGWGGSPMMYKGMWDVLAKAVEKEGVKGLYKVTTCFSSPSSAISRPCAQL